MGYLARWKVLEEMITDFRKRGVSVPSEIIGNIRNAKTLISVLRVDPSHVETNPKVDENLRSVESYLVFEGQKNFGSEYVEEWLERLKDANQRVVEEEEEKEARFIPGLPRNHKWIRVRPSQQLPLEELKPLTDELGLSYRLQSDGCLLVYGETERIRDFVRRMTARYGLKTEK